MEEIVKRTVSANSENKGHDESTRWIGVTSHARLTMSSSCTRLLRTVYARVRDKHSEAIVENNVVVRF